MTPAQQVAGVFASTPPGEMPPIPEFLLVKNRRPLTRNQRSRRASYINHTSQSNERIDWRKPKGTPREEWDAYLARKEESERNRTPARVAALKDRYGDRPKIRRIRSDTAAPKRFASGVPRVRGKAAMVAELLTRPGGCTTADALVATGWPSISMPATARTAGLALRKERVDGVLRYYGTRG